MISSLASMLLAATLGLGSQSTMNSSPDQERLDRLHRAMESTLAAIEAVKAAPDRPAFHYHAPANWMNDPNGPIFYKGWFHLFYQFNPYGDQWGNMHWGHARSRNLVDWEDLPIALWPSKARGEEHVYSGSTFLDGHGKPIIFYTSIGDKRDPEQWAATSADGDLLHWEKHPKDPVLTQAAHGAHPLAEWRDPFPFHDGGKTYLLVGGGLDGHGVVALYRAENPELTAWHYEGPVFRHPDADVANIECPNIVKIGKHWVLLVSVHGRVESFVGDLDPERRTFNWTKRGILADGSYASQLATDSHGRCIHLAWIPTSDHKGWNGLQTLPSVLTLSHDGELLRNPAPELKDLRTGTIRLGKTKVDGVLDLSDKAPGDTLELVADIDPGTATKLGFRLATQILTYDTASHDLALPNGRHLSIPLDPKSHRLKLHVFLDRTTLDVYAAEGAATAASHGSRQPGSSANAFFTEGGAAEIHSLAIHPLRPAKFDHSRINLQ